MNNKVNSVLNSIEKIDHLVMEADVSVSDAMNDVYNKQFKMEGNVTEDYINHEYYQESVIAGILIGGGIIAVLATAIVLITKHVKKSASGDPEKKDDKSTAAGIALDKPEDVKKRLDEVAKDLDKLGGKVTIPSGGIITEELGKLFEKYTKFFEIAEKVNDDANDEAIDNVATELDSILEEIKNSNYKHNGSVEVDKNTVNELANLSAVVADMTKKSTETATKLQKRAEEAKKKVDSETNTDKKQKSEALNKKLSEISKKATTAGTISSEALSGYRGMIDQIIKSIDETTEKNKSSEAEKKTESEDNTEPKQNVDLVKQRIWPVISKWTTTPSNSDPKRPGVKLTDDEAYNIISDIYTDIINHRHLNALDKLKAKANESPEKAILIKNLVETTITNENVFDTDETTINGVKSGLSDLESIAATAPTDEPKKDETEHTNTDRQTSDTGYMLNTNPAFFAEISNLKNTDDFNKITVSEEVFKEKINELIGVLNYKTNTQFDDKDRVDGFIGEIKTVLSALSSHISLLKSCSSESMKFLDLMEDFITGITVPADDTEANNDLTDIRNTINNVKSTIGVEQQTDGTNPAAENNITPEQDQDEKFEELRQKITANLKNKYQSGCNIISLYGYDIEDVVTVILGMCMSNKSEQEIQNTANDIIFGFIKSTTTLASNNVRYAIPNKKFKDQPAEYQNALNALINAVNMSIDEASKITGTSYTIDTRKYTYDLTGKFYNKIISSHADLKEAMIDIENKFGQTQQQSQTSNDTQPENTNQNTDSDTSNLSGLARLKDHIQVPDIVKEANQLDEPGVKEISKSDMQELQKASAEKLIPFIEKGMEIFYHDGNSYKLDSMPLSRKNVRLISSFAGIINQIYDADTDLDAFLTQKYLKDMNQKLKDFYYQMAKLYAQEMNIHVTLTDPNGKKEEINANPVFN